ncbi:MAG TPA: twin-arginine translocase subunit TatC [Jatrophihabitans sp.]|uniref:twin-arginine translocase subunit TatC n=1 Tax=Jatrophihabitans sp. TaxID=1932789 RepID=UPI002E0723A4|nr:twin-arginine translocase subunit TatC [Jatrophihabitans sp.]
MPVLDHLRELRRRVIYILLFVALGAVLGWVLYPHTLHFLREPYCSVPQQYRYTQVGTGNCVLIYHGVLDGFTTRLKVSVISGAVFTGPLWLYQIWAFITPGLRKNEKRYTLMFVAASTVLFAAGMSLAYVVLSKGLKILLEQAGYGTAAQLTVSDYISFVTLMLVVFGAAFELPLLVIMANFAGVLSAKVLKKSQRIAIFLIFLFAAVATPSTDPFTMCAMAIPMVVLFEGAVVIAVIHDRRKARRLAEERAASHLEDDVASTIDPIPEALPARVDSWSDTT